MKAIEEQPNSTVEPLQVMGNEINTQIRFVSAVVAMSFLVVAFPYLSKLIVRRFWR